MFFKPKPEPAPSTKFSILPGEIARIAFFNDISDEELSIMSEYLRQRVFKANEYVFKEGDKQNAAFFLMKGTVIVLKDTNEEKQEVLAEIKAPQVFGELALVSHGKRSASILAKDDLVVAELNTITFDRLMELHPKLAAHIMRKVANIISTRLREINASYVEVVNLLKKK